MERIDGRGDMELREVKIRTGVMLHAHGSCEIRSGRTTVLCSAMIEKGVPPFLEGTGKGWLTAEYSIPENYFPDDDDTKDPIVRWRGHANLLFSNWLNYFVYQTTPYDIMAIGDEEE